MSKEIRFNAFAMNCVGHMAPGLWRHPRDRSDRYIDLSWDRDAVRRDRKSGIFADPAKVHGIEHSGKYFRVPGFNLSEPSPQRTPVLYQAGASRRGKDFAAKHAECVFVSAPSAAIIKKYVQDLRQRAAELGRGQILIFAMFTIIVAPTEAEAKEKLDEYRSYIDYEGALVLMFDRRNRCRWIQSNLCGYAGDLRKHH